MIVILRAARRLMTGLANLIVLLALPFLLPFVVICGWLDRRRDCDR